MSDNEVFERYHAWRYSWVAYNPDWTFMLWDKNNTPYEKLSPNGRRLLEMKLKFTVKSDIIRWELLYLFGGVWADMDTECQKPLEGFLQYDSFAGISPYGDGIGNAVVGCHAGDSLIKELRDATNEAVLSDIPRSFDSKRLNAAHGAEFAGQNYLYRIAKILPAKIFYPYGPLDAWRIRANPNQHKFPESHVIHKWEGTTKEGWGHVDT